MDVMEQLRAWGVAHAEARSAESAARHGDETGACSELRHRAQSLRDRAHRLHRAAYDALGARGRETHPE